MPAPGTRRIALLVAAILSSLLVLSSAAEASRGPEHFSAGDQYVETLPSTKGPKATDDGGGRHAKDRGAAVALPPGLRQKLLAEGGPAAAELIEIATSPQLGASDSKRRSGGRARSQPGVPSAAIEAVGGGQAGLGWLVVALLLITALALGAVGYQRHRDKGSDAG